MDKRVFAPGKAALWTGVSALLLSAVAGQGHAQTSGALVEELIVTAQKREQRLEEVPATVATLSAAALERSNVTDFHDLGRMASSVVINQTGVYNQTTIRGVGNALLGGGAEGNVSVYVDDFYIASMIASPFELGNVERVEVLKGPQGTLFGRNATGGAILIHTKDPSPEASAKITGTYANYNDRTLGAVLSSGNLGNASIGLVGNIHATDSYLRDLRTGARTGKYTNYSVQSRLVWEPLEDLKISTQFEVSHVGAPTGIARFALDGNASGRRRAGSTTVLDPTILVATEPFTTSWTLRPIVDIDSHALWNKIEWNSGSWDVKVRTFWRKNKMFFQADTDFTYLRIGDAVTHTEEETVSNEVNVTYTSDKLTWVTGTFLYRSIPTQPSNFTLDRPAVTNTADNKSAAIFTDLTYDLTDRLTVIAGVRYSIDKRTFHQFALPGVSSDVWMQGKWKPVTPRLIARYQLDERQYAYASWGRGFKSGGFNTVAFRVVDPEFISAYEVGYKLAGQRIRFNAAAFHYDYTDLQVNSPDEFRRSVLQNAGSSRIRGVDIETEVAVTDGFNVFFNVAYLDAKYTSFPAAVGVVPNGFSTGNVTVTRDVKGNALIRSPEWSGTIGAEWRHDTSYGEFVLSGNYAFTSRIWFDVLNRVGQDAYGLLGLRAVWNAPGDRYSVAVFGTNVTDERYLVGGSFTPAADSVYAGAPRQYGVTLQAKF